MQEGVAERGLDRQAGALLAFLLLIVLALLLIPVAWGTGLGDSLIFLAYLAVFIMLPGIAVACVLAPGARLDLFRVIAIGGGVGYLLSTFAFSLTAELGLRDAYGSYPLVILVPCGVLLIGQFRRNGRPTVELPSAVVSGATLGVFLLAAFSFAIYFFGKTPLLDNLPFSYFQDFSWTIALAADALHNWPMMEPGVAGEPMPYHNFIHLHLASASQVTGIELPVVFFRLWILPVIALATIQFVATGKALLDSRTSGLGGAALTWLVGGIGLTFSAFLFPLLTSSPSFLYGMVIFLPLVLLIGERLQSDRLSINRGEWVLLAILLAGAPGAKVSILPLATMALGILCAFTIWRDRRLPLVALILLGLILIVQGVWYLDQYLTHESGLMVNFTAGFDLLKGTSPLSVDALKLAGIATGPEVLRPIITVVAVISGFLALFGPALSGLWWEIRSGNPFRGPARAWLFSLLLAGLLSFLFLETEASSNQLYFTYYGIAAGGVLSSSGLILAIQAASLSKSKLVILLIAWALVMLVFMALSGRISTVITPSDYGLAVVLSFLWIVVALVALVIAVRYGGWGGFGLTAVVVAGAFVLAGALDSPSGEIKGQLQSDPPGVGTGQHLTPGLLGALLWLRDNSAVGDVFIVNNQGWEAGSQFPVAYDYPAFSERRAWLAGWGYSSEARDFGFDRVVKGESPFGERERLNNLAFQGDPQAIAELKRAGVSFALIDEVNGAPADPRSIEKLGETVYESGDATLIKLAPGPQGS